MRNSSGSWTSSMTKYFQLRDPAPISALQYRLHALVGPLEGAKTSSGNQRNSDPGSCAAVSVSALQRRLHAQIPLSPCREITFRQATPLSHLRPPILIPVTLVCVMLLRVMLTNNDF